MADDNIKILDTFDIHSLPNLDIAVLGALELFEKAQLPKIDISYKHPLIVGSGNGETTGRIIFKDEDAVFASESSYLDKLRNIASIDGVVLISASGGKHAPSIAKESIKLGKKVTLITSTENSPTKVALSDNEYFNEFVFPKNREPYTYNTSTYLAMILGKTGENPATIKAFIENDVSTLQFPDFSEFQKYYLIIPPQYSEMIPMLQKKFLEMFGRTLARDIESSEYVRHATTVVPSHELFISFGDEPNTMWGAPENRLHVPLPEDAGYGAMVAVSYYTVAQIQKHYAHYFKDNIEAYTSKISQLFDSPITPIVEK